MSFDPFFSAPSPTPRPKRSRTALWVSLLLVGCLALGFVGGALGSALFAPKPQDGGFFDPLEPPATLPSRPADPNADPGQDPTPLQPPATKPTVLPATPPNTGEMMSVAQVAASAADTVVEIVTEVVTTGYWMQQYVSEGAGSGVIITADGMIATNHHVIDGASDIRVTLRGGQTYEAELVATDMQTDVAVLKIDAQDLPYATFGDSDTLVVGEPVVAIGNPLGQLGGTVTDGIISALGREIAIDGQIMTLLQTNAAVNPGNSGGGLFDRYGRLIGLVNAKSSGNDVEGLGFAIPANTAKAVINDLLTYGYVRGRVTLGISWLDITSSQQAWMYGVSAKGVYVYSVAENSPAKEAGFRSGDRVTAVNGNNVTASAEIELLLQKMNIGDTLTFQLVRGKEKLTLQVTLQEYVPAGSLG